MKCFTGLILLMLPLLAAAEVVVPIESVENHVNIRMTADSASEIVGRLDQGDYLPLVRSIEDWHVVEIAGGATGFISSDWVNVLDEPPAVIEESETPSEVADADSASPDSASADSAPVDEPAVVVVAEEESSVTGEDVAEMDTQDSETKPNLVVADEIIEESFETVAVEEAVPEIDEEVSAAEPQKDEVVAVDAVSEPKEEAVVPLVTEEIAEAVVEEDADVADDMVMESEEVAPALSETGEQDVDVVMEEEVITGESVVTIAEPGPQGLPGPQGPQGMPGPQGPAGAASIEGSVGFLTRFTAPTIGGTSQVYDDGTNIGIGTIEPKQRLEVNGNIQIHQRNASVAGLMITQSDGDTGYIMHNRASTLTIGAGSVDRITIDSDGNVGFGVAQPSNPIQMASGAHVTAGGVWTNSSSRAKKENIAELSLDDALMTLVQLEPVHFNYKNDQSESYVGFIAEDVPDLVATNDRDGLSSMDIVAVLTRVVQEQQKKIEALEARLDQR